MQQQVYACGRCFLKTLTAQALDRALKVLLSKGYGLILYDCYRPAPVQQKLWEITPDKRFVAPPDKGSTHSRGMAVDLSMTDLGGTVLDMGTDYDYFGPEAAPSYSDLSDEILQRRQILREALWMEGFGQARSEWWHFSLRNSPSPLYQWEWKCP